MTEKWLPVTIPGYEDRYDISDCGRLRRTKRSKGARVGRPVRGTTNDLGYKVVNLCRPEKRKTYLMHHLVLFAFVGPRPEGLECDHYDGDSLNNNVSNLRWVTRMENIANRTRLGGTVRGEANGQSKLTDVKVREILGLFKNGMIVNQIAKKYGVCHLTITETVRGLRWKHITNPEGV